MYSLKNPVHKAMNRVCSAYNKGNVVPNKVGVILKERHLFTTPEDDCLSFLKGNRIERFK